MKGWAPRGKVVWEQTHDAGGLAPVAHAGFSSVGIVDGAQAITCRCGTLSAPRRDRV